MKIRIIIQKNPFFIYRAQNGKNASYKRRKIRRGIGIGEMKNQAGKIKSKILTT